MSKTKTEEITCPNFIWRLFIRDGVYYADGRRHGHGKPSLNTRNRKQAIQNLIELDACIAEDQRSTAETGNSAAANGDRNGPIPISEGWQRYLDGKSGPVHLGGLKVTSKKKYRSHRVSFVAFCAVENIDCWTKVNKSVLQSYGSHIDGKFAPRTIHNDITMQISVSNWLITENLIPDSCKIKWKLKKPSGSDRFCYAREEVSRMLELTLEDRRLHWLHNTIILLSHTGLRIGEAVHLRWSDVDLPGGVIRVRDESFSDLPASQRRTLKDGESRSVPIHNALLDHLQARKETGYVLRAVKGGQLNINYARERFIAKVIKPLSSEFPSSKDEIGFENGRFHSFRHFFVSEAFAAGVPECDIRDWVGHSDSKIVELYRHLRSETAKANVQLINFGA